MEKQGKHFDTVQHIHQAFAKSPRKKFYQKILTGNADSSQHGTQGGVQEATFVCLQSANCSGFEAC
jgi:hypothetical protein